mmetsp:Transcript_27497/g.74020  ORF Transcript_27497/g.74020 Transcript_27497/m.74020 type:complete len:736 (+) Transcript_27497:53-2260(+)
MLRREDKYPEGAGGTGSPHCQCFAAVLMVVIVALATLVSSLAIQESVIRLERRSPQSELTLEGHTANRTDPHKHSETNPDPDPRALGLMSPGNRKVRVRASLPPAANEADRSQSTGPELSAGDAIAAAPLVVALNTTQQPRFRSPGARPSFLIAVASFGPGKESVRTMFLRAMGAMCPAGLGAALLVDVAGVERPGWWEQELRLGGPRGKGFPLGCAAHKGHVQTVVRYHDSSVGDHLTGMHRQAFLSNLDVFDWFAYLEDDLGWTPQGMLAYAAEIARLDRAVTGTSPHAPVDGMRALASPRLGAAALGAGVFPGFLRWEANKGHEALNDAPMRTRTSLAALNKVPLSAVSGNDLIWNAAMGYRAVVRLGGELWWEPKNPFAASYVLPTHLLSAAWSGGPPKNRKRKFMIKEYYGGCWLYAQDFVARAPLRPKGNFSKVRKLLPCNRSRLTALLAMHNSNSKYTLGDGGRYSARARERQELASMEALLDHACTRAGVLDFATQAWHKSGPKDKFLLMVERQRKKDLKRQQQLSLGAQRGRRALAADEHPLLSLPRRLRNVGTLRVRQRPRSSTSAAMQQVQAAVSRQQSQWPRESHRARRRPGKGAATGGGGGGGGGQLHSNGTADVDEGLLLANASATPDALNTSDPPSPSAFDHLEAMKQLKKAGTTKSAVTVGPRPLVPESKAGLDDFNRRSSAFALARERTVTADAQGVSTSSTSSSTMTSTTTSSNATR